MLDFTDPPVHVPARGCARRIILYSHDTLGFGHLRRNLLIATALKARLAQAEILMIGGMREAGAFEFPKGVDCITLPAYAKGSDGTYAPRDLGGDLAALTELRAKMIKATVKAFAPDLMIIDNVPRGALFELDQTLAMLKARGKTRIVLGLRDVIDTPSEVRKQWIRQRNFETVRKFYDAVCVYGDPAFYDLLEDCGLDKGIGVPAQHMGYLDHSTRLSSAVADRDRDAVLAGDTSPYVLCAVGGGRDGAALCEAFARAPLPEGHRGILVTGTQMPDQLRTQLHDAIAGRDDITLVPFVREPIALMAGAARIVSMGGYNTTCEILLLRRTALIVPRAEPRQEQLIRTRHLAARGLVSMLHPDDLTPDAIGQWLRAEPLNDRSRTPDMNGLSRFCMLMADMLAPERELARAS